jgi:uncharacterized repeat protein (TIGR01451 family)
LISSFLLWFAFLGLIARPANAQTLSAAPGQIASLRYSLTVDADTLKINSIVTYTIRIENTPGSADQLDSVVAFFKLPQLSTGRVLLKPPSFKLLEGEPPVGFPNNVVNLTNGQIRWDFLSISRSTPKKIVFSFALEDIAKISFQSCGETYLTATLDIEASDRGVRVRPGPRSVESILDVRPDMELGPISGDRAAQRGRIVSYIIRYSNVGNVGDNATVCIKLPLGADAQNVRTAPDTIKKRMVTADSLCFDVGLVPADSLVKTFVVRVPLMASISSQVDSVCISVLIASLCDTSEFNNGPRDRCIPLDPLDLLSLTKLATPAVVSVGDTVSYTIRYANLDSILTAYNLSVVDVLPSGTQFITADAPFQFSNNRITWRLDSLAARSSGELHYSVRVPLDFYRNQANAAACQGTFISNFAEITSTGAGGAPSPESSVKLDNNRAIRSVFVRPLGDLLALTVTVDTTRVNPAAAALLPGDTLTYNLRFRNNSSRLTATNAVLADTLPDPQIVTLLTPSRLAGFVYEPASNRLVRRNLVLAPGQTGSVSFRVMIRTDVATCTAQNLFNRAGIRDSLEFDCDLANNADRDTVRMPATGDLLAVVLSANRRVIVDTLGQVSFTLDYRNTGTIAALNVVVADTLPPELEFVSSAPAPSRSPGGNIFFWDIGTLARGGAGTILINARVRRNVATCDSLALRSRAGVSSSPADCNLGNNAAAAAVTLRTDPAQQPQLVMMQPTLADFQDQNNDGCAEPGELITMRLQVRNISLIAATRPDTVKMRATLGTIQSFRFEPATLSPGAVGTATFQIRTGESDRLDSLALTGQITAAGFCPRPLSGKYCFKPRARIGVPAGLAPVSINDRDGNRNGCADDNGGELLNVVVRYQNLSAIPADSVDLKVVVTPPGFALLGSNRNATRSGAAGDTFRIRVSLAPGQIDSLILKISYADFDAQQVMVTTTATLRVSTVAAPVVQSAALLVCRECYARPNPFIPSRHIDPAMNMDGVRFAPNDGQNVDIFDLQGNRVRRLRTNERWNGRDGGGKDCPAGVYLWVIEGHCRGTIVVVR